VGDVTIDCEIFCGALDGGKYKIVNLRLTFGTLNVPASFFFILRDINFVAAGWWYRLF
jgi:hypothetical protein